MLNNHDHDISVVNSLVATTIDSADGYERSAENARNTEFESLFIEFAQQRRQVVGQLQQTVRRLGGNPDDEGSVLASLHRRFEDLRTAFSGGDDKAVIDEVERGEDHIKGKYLAALKDEELSPECRQVIERAYQLVRAGHDRMSQLKHSLQA